MRPIFWTKDRLPCAPYGASPRRFASACRGRCPLYREPFGLTPHVETTPRSHSQCQVWSKRLGRQAVRPHGVPAVPLPGARPGQIAPGRTPGQPLSRARVRSSPNRFRQATAQWLARKGVHGVETCPQPRLAPSWLDWVPHGRGSEGARAQPSPSDWGAEQPQPKQSARAPDNR